MVVVDRPQGMVLVMDNRMGLVVEGGRWLVGMVGWVDMLQLGMEVAALWEEGMLLLVDKEQD